MTRTQRRIGVNPPMQRRSAETHQRILDAATDLSRGRDLDDVSIQEICDAAGVSASSFYARFPTKKVLVRALYEQHVDHVNAFVAEAIANVPWDDLPLEGVVRTVMAHYLSYRQLHEDRMRTMMLAQLRDPTIAERRRRHDEDLRSLVATYLAARLDDHDPAFVARLPLVVHIMCGAIRAAVERPERFLPAVGASGDDLVDELTRLFLARVALARNVSDVVIELD